MSLFDKFFKTKPKDWSQLSAKQKTLVASRLKSTIKNMLGSRYKVVSGPDQFNRELGSAETREENEILNMSQRAKLLSLCRNQVRNSPTFASMARSLLQNSIGINGGKVILDYEDEALNKEILRQFKKFNKNADFFDGSTLNTVLKTLFLEYLIGGDCVILFDSGYITGSGKLLIFESDEIGDVPQEVVQKHYGKYAHSKDGIVFDMYGRQIGVIVSKSCRGLDSFEPDKCFYLKRDPDGLNEDADWLMPKNTFRTGMWRGITGMTTMLANNEDLEMLTNFELQSAKQASQTLMQIYKEGKAAEEQLPSAFDNIDFSKLTDDEIEQIAKEEVKDEQVVSLQAFQSANAIYQVLPDNYKAALLDTKRPNPNLPAFIKFLCQRSGMPFGLTEQYVTLATDGASYRAQSLISKPMFQDVSHWCEQICDWIFIRWMRAAQAKGILPVNIPEDYMDYVDWEWADIEELDRNGYQDYVNKGLANGTVTYKDVLGSNWKKKLQQVKVECEYFDKELKTLHPSLALKSGGESQYVEKKDSDLTKEQT